MAAALVALGFGAAPAPAQIAAPDPAPGWELNVHGATLLDNLFESSGQAIQGGVRVLRQTGSGFGFGGNFDYVMTPDVVVAPGIGAVNAGLLLYSVEVDYLVPVSPRADFFVGAGFGGATVRFADGAGASRILAESSTGQLVPIGAGFKLRNRPVDSTWALRFDVRDNVILLSTRDASGEATDEPRHNIELSAGISFLFGDRARRSPMRDAARPAPEPAAGDADRDGVPDARDQCPATTAGVEIDSFGCPVPLDADEDGVADAGDRCPGTPVGTAVGRDGCPVAPAEEPAREEAPADQPPAAPEQGIDEDRDGVPERAEPPGAVRPAPVADTDGDGVPDRDDRCVNTPAGVSVDGRGCPVPVDQDGDGVFGATDRCPGTPAGARVDERGCEVPEPEPTAEAERPAPEPRAEPATPEPDEQPAPAAPERRAPGPPAACVDARVWYENRAPIEFEGSRWTPSGNPEPINLENLEMIGVHDGVPVFVGSFVEPPYPDVWLPRCSPAGNYQLYVREGAER